MRVGRFIFISFSKVHSWRIYLFYSKLLSRMLRFGSTVHVSRRDLVVILQQQPKWCPSENITLPSLGIVTAPPPPEFNPPDWPTPASYTSYTGFIQFIMMPNSSALDIRRIGLSPRFPLKSVINKVTYHFSGKQGRFGLLNRILEDMRNGLSRRFFFHPFGFLGVHRKCQILGIQCLQKEIESFFLLLRHHQWLIGHQYFFALIFFADSPEGTKSTVVYLQCVYRILLGVK